MKYLQRCGGGRENPAGGAVHSRCQPWKPSQEGRNPRTQREIRGERLCPAGSRGIETLPSLCFWLSISCWGFSPLESTGSRGRGALRFTPWLILQDGFGGAAKEAHVTCPLDLLLSACMAGRGDWMRHTFSARPPPHLHSAPTVRLYLPQNHQN